MSDRQVSPLTVPSMMRAVRLHPPGGPASLVLEDLATPKPGPGQALVRVFAAAITRGELDWPVDRLPAIPSYEFSGIVVAAALDVTDTMVGEAVYALCPFDHDGAAADYTVVPSTSLAPKPRSLDHLRSAAVPLAGLSAWQGLLDHGHLEQGQRVLIHGAAGGVGSLAVQIAHHRGAHVIGTTSTANVAAVRELGVDQVIDYTETHFEDALDSLDLVFDTVGGDRLQKSLEVLRSGGRLVSVAEEPPRSPADSRGLTSLYFVVKPNRDQLRALADLIDRGDLEPSVTEVFPLANARRAFERSLGRHGLGKIVLHLADE
jgi:NADPH:quinone reductase-like Zn-dependent oxidoreductase